MRRGIAQRPDLVAFPLGGLPTFLEDSNYARSLYLGNEGAFVRTRFRDLWHLRSGISDILQETQREPT